MYDLVSFKVLDKQRIEEYMRYRELPIHIRERITSYYEHKYSQRRLFDEHEVLSEISGPLRDEIINHNCRDLIESVPFLKQGGPDFVTKILNKVSFDVYLPGDVIVKEGTFGTSMFFIRSGTVDVIAEETHITSLYEGDYFGEITMLTNARRVASVKSATVVEMFLLSKPDLLEVLEEYPSMRCLMEAIALSRLNELGEQLVEYDGDELQTYNSSSTIGSSLGVF